MILFLTNADSEILALRSVLEALPEGFPVVRAANPSVLAGPPSLEGALAVIVRLLGGAKAWQEPFGSLRRACRQQGVPLLAFGGEAVPDDELTGASTVPAAAVLSAFEYLVAGGPGNVANLLLYVSDTVLGTRLGFDPPKVVPETGILGDPVIDPARPTVGVVFYRAHLLSGNTTFVTDLCAAIEARGANALPVYCYSLRRPAGTGGGEGAPGRAPAIELLARHGVDALVTTVLAAGSSVHEGDGWDASGLASLDVPVVQAVASTSSEEEWDGSDSGLSPLDVAMAVAVPELDGRIVTVPFSFKETVDDGEGIGSAVTAYRTVADRRERVAGVATRLARLRHKPVSSRRVALVLSAYPTKRSRIGNAVGLDTPASVVALLHELSAAGYGVDRIPPDGDALMAELADSLTYDREWLSPAQAARAPGRWSAEDSRRSHGELQPGRGGEQVEAWGGPPGSVYLEPGADGAGDLVFPGLDLGSVLVTVQPPRGFGENPVAVYHSPDLAPTHHYLGFYRWLDEGWGADAVVHVGKHGTLEWLPGKSVGLSSSCWPDAVLGDLPLVYPFVVNDPGEGTQAKRRAHAVIVDHLVPPLTRAETYDDLARLESLLDTHAAVASLDPTKLPAVRRQVWDLLVSAEIHRDLGLVSPERPAFDDPGFDDLLVEVDGYLCELKDAQIRGGLHVLGRPPEGGDEIDLVLACTRLDQGQVPSLRRRVAKELGVDLSQGRRRDVDLVEAECRSRLARLQAEGWNAPGDDSTIDWICDRLVPALRRTPDELSNLVASLAGRHVPSGPSGAPSRGMAHVLPTGRNFYSVDPRAVPSSLAWEVGSRLAGSLLDRHLAEEGRYPRSVGIVVWGTAVMRTAGDDVAEALALLGARPVWEEESGRVTGVEVVPLAELGRPRIDVTLRVSGFFRDAFPHLIELVDRAVQTVASLPESPEDNFLVANGAEDARIFGPKPAAYGSGILTLLESGDWKDDADLAEVYLTWGGYSYSRKAMGAAAPETARRRLAAIEVAVKNQDNREHDIFDSDDYLQDHGGMVATVRALSGRQPKAWFGDSADPSRPRVRSLAEEAARVVRTRVVNPKWIEAMRAHGYKGAFEMAATVDYLFGYDATTGVAEDWMYERVTAAYVAAPESRAFFSRSNPWALRSIAERLLEADERGLWSASSEARAALRDALLEAEGWEEGR
jgi:cobaltochelatase CobN